jgi:excisionase family DNA binding protein
MVKRKLQTKTTDASELISQAEAARLRGVTRGAIQDLVRRGRIRAVSVAGRTLVYKGEIESYEKGEPGRPPATKAAVR